MKEKLLARSQMDTQKKETELKSFHPFSQISIFAFSCLHCASKQEEKKVFFGAFYDFTIKDLFIILLGALSSHPAKKAQLRFKRASEDESAMQHCNIQFLV